MKDTSEQPSETYGLSVSLVAFKPNMAQLLNTFASLDVACANLRARSPIPVHLFLVNNGGLPDMSSRLAALRERGIECTLISGHGNVGYGRGHNLAIERADSLYHLVLNPDINIDPDALSTALTFLNIYHDAGLLSPRIGDDAGHIQYLCRRYPTLLDLLVRGFFPSNLRRFFARRLASYEMRDQINERDIVWDPPIVSGCFMLFRTKVLKKLAGFDPRYFLYFEDYDLSLRTHDVARVVYVPSVRVVHDGGGAAKKGLAHVKMFAASAFKFFNRFGWKLV